MKRVRIDIETINAAFDDDAAGHEVARILRAVADGFEESGRYRFSKVYDLNGNACGTVKITG